MLKEKSAKFNRLIEKEHFSHPTIDPFDEIQWEKRTTAITDDQGNTVFEQNNVEVPSQFSELATKIIASKYFYGDIELGDDPQTGGRENSVKQVILRITETLAEEGLKKGYFANKDESSLFEKELRWLLIHQCGAFNSPVWFNLGLYQKYGIGEKAGEGNFYWDEKTATIQRSPNQYKNPQCSACFIQKVEDSIESIMELAKSEAMLFKYGSGSGSDLSSLRSSREKLSGGGKPSGPLSFLGVYDSVAGVIKSGGKTRRAAKMNTLKDSHPDVEEFIQAKSIEEKKAWALIEQGYDPSFNGEAYGSIKFQNENLSIRASDEFMQAAVDKSDWWTKKVSDGQPCEKKSAACLLRQIAEGTHLCGDPGLQFDDTIDYWHTCKGSGRQNCTNPCSEYLFLDNSACNLASINLKKFNRNGVFDTDSFIQACRIFIIAQDIIVDHSSYPTREIAYNSHWFRTLGLGYANLGALLIEDGLAYDSEEGRKKAAEITALMTGAAYLTSVDLAKKFDPFGGYHDAHYLGEDNPPAASNKESMLTVIKRHLEAVEQLSKSGETNCNRKALTIWKKVFETGKETGFRNAQVSVLAPTGTIGFLMDCDTTGIEPAMGLVVYKQLAGGGLLTLPLNGIPQALAKLGYHEDAIAAACEHIKNYGTLESVTVKNQTIHSGIQEDHFPIFDTAFRSGMGTRSLVPKAHIDMMAAVQPFLSGGISKTVNMPNESSVTDIEETYIYAWKKGIKGVAIYRDGSKRSAPVSSKLEEGTETAEKQIITEPFRRKLPDTRNSLTHKFSIGGSKGYITVGEFDDGTPGEVFLQMAKAGSTINGLMDCIGTLMSLSLQYGVPLEALVQKFSHVRFEPEGLTRNPDIPMAKSVIDYLARWLGMEYIQGYKEKMSPNYPSSEADSIEQREPRAIAIEKEDSKTSNRLNSEQLELLVQSEGNLTCPECGSSKVKVTGTCACCLNCGTSLGCS